MLLETVCYAWWVWKYLFQMSYSVSRKYLISQGALIALRALRGSILKFTRDRELALSPNGQRGIIERKHVSMRVSPRRVSQPHHFACAHLLSSILPSQQLSFSPLSIFSSRQISAYSPLSTFHAFSSSCLPPSLVRRCRLLIVLRRSAVAFKPPSPTTSTRHQQIRLQPTQNLYRTITTPLPRFRRLPWYPPRCRLPSFQSECGSANLLQMDTRPSWL